MIRKKITSSEEVEREELRFRKIYRMEDCSIRVGISPNIVQIISDEELWRFLSQNTKERSRRLSRKIKEDHRKLLGAELLITQKSLSVEILGHVLTDIPMAILEKLLGTRMDSTRRFIRRYTHQIDCGSKEKDTNRWFWDLISPFELIFAALVPRKLARLWVIEPERE